MLDDIGSDSSDDEEQMEKRIPLKSGLDVRKLFKDEGVEMEVDLEAIESQFSEMCNSNTYRYDENSLDTLISENLEGGENNSGESDSEESYFVKLSKQMEKLTDDGGVMKRITSNGYGVIVPKDATIRIHYNAYLEGDDEPFDSTVLRGRELKINLADARMGLTIFGLDIGVKTMSKNEKADFLIRPEYAFGKMGCPPRIPANATILYKVELLDFVDNSPAIQFDNMSYEEKSDASFATRIAAIKSRIEIGNDEFNQGQYKQALKSYKTAIKILTSKCSLNDDAEEKRWKTQLVRANLSSAVCHLKMGNYPPVITYTRDVIEYDPNNAKAFYLQGKAHTQLGNFRQAYSSLEKARKLKPNDDLIRKALSDLQIRRDHDRVVETVFYRKMFGQDDIRPASISQLMEDNMTAFITRFVKDDECDEVSFPFKIPPKDVNWLIEKVKGMNLNAKINYCHKSEEITLLKICFNLKN